MLAPAQKMLAKEVDNAPSELKRQIARERILRFCGEQWDSKDGMVNHTVQQLRAKFDTLKAQKDAVELGVSWQSLIDEMIRNGEIRVTNGVVWAP